VRLSTKLTQGRQQLALRPVEEGGAPLAADLQEETAAHGERSWPREQMVENAVEGAATAYLAVTR
jgi:hypothetical protein